MRKGIIYVYFNRAKYEKEGVEKYYVGQTVGTMEQRAGKDGKNYHKNNPDCNNKFANSIRKWGWNAFEGRVLEEVYEEDLNELEKFYIEYFDSFKNGYNSTIGGEGMRGYSFSEESKKRISIAVKKRFQNPEEKEKQSIIQKKHWEDKEYKEKQSILQKKLWEDEEKRKKQSEIQKKCWKDPKKREKQSITLRKSWEDEERRKKQSEKMSIISKKRFQDKSEREKCSQPGESNPYARKVYCDTLNIVFSYIGLAEKYCINILNSKASKISLTCNGKRKSSGKLANGTKLIWKYIENVDKKILDNAIYIDSKKYEEIINEKINNQ